MLNELKEQVLVANLELAKQGLVTLTWGNVSGLDRERKLVVIKPSGVSYEKLQASDMVVVGLDGKVVEGTLWPSTDTPTHLALYRAWPDIGGVTHTHSTYAAMFAQACRALECYGTTHADGFHGPVPITRPLTEAEVKQAYEANTGVVILEQFAPNPGKPQPLEMPGVLVANHGPFAWGKDALDSVEHAVMLEACAKMALGTLLLAPKMPPVPQYILDKHYFRKHGPGAYYGQREQNDGSES